MRQTISAAVVREELDAVADKLAADRITPEQRLVLLRRQADLGDLRDAIADRARRREE